MGLDYLCLWFYHLYNQYDFARINENDLPWYDTVNDAYRLDGQLHSAGGILLSAAGAAGAFLSLNRPRPTLP
jgi:hypothetical protein